MNVDELVRDALREQAAEQFPVGAGFADRVLAVRRRRRTRRLVAAAAATAAVVAVSVVVPLLDSGKEDVRPSGVVGQDTVNARPDQSPPSDLISAGNTALAGYVITDTVKKTKDTGVRQRTYYLLNPKTGKYVKTTKWSWVAVAPGLKTAAVLEQQEQPASRIGLLDLTTGKVERWIQVDHKVGGLAFSRDGRKLVATTYGENPDALYKPQDGGDWGPKMSSSRTGFYVFDVASGTGSWAEVKLDSDPEDPMGSFLNARQDFALTDDGRHVWAGNPEGDIGKEFWDLSGNKVSAPANDKYLSWYVDAGKSPNGKLVAGDFAGKKWKTSSFVLDAATGKSTEVRGQQLLAWVGNRQLIAWDIGQNDKNEFHQRLVLITIGSAKEVPLSGFRQGNDGDAGRWDPIFAQN